MARPPNTARKLNEREQLDMRFAVDEIKTERSAIDSPAWRRRQYIELRDKLHDVALLAHSVHNEQIAADLRKHRNTVCKIIENEDY